MPDTAGAADTHVVGSGLGTSPGRPDVVRDGLGAEAGGPPHTGTPGGSTTSGREGRGR